MSNTTSTFWRIFKFILFQPVANFKYCSIYKHKNGSSITQIFRYVCYTTEICCDVGNGCCPRRRSIKYYESWCFWVFVFAMVLGFYLLCWYCKKLEKERVAERGNGDSDRNPPRILPSSLRSVETNNVDHLLETLILSYRNRLGSEQQNQPSQNVDETKILSTVDPPPKYIDALKMPKPQKPDAVVTGNNPAENDTSIPEQNNSDDDKEEDDNFVVLYIVDDEAVPSYEDAIKKL